MPRFCWILPGLFAACTSPHSGATKIIGHGGMGSGATLPMNSKASVHAALALGIEGVEMDVQLTADSVLVGFHPDDLSALTACTGKVNSQRWEQLQACQVMHEGFSYPLVRLDSLLPELANEYPTAEFTLDCKLFTQGDWWGYLHAFTDGILQLNDNPRLRGKLLVDCQTEDFLRLLCLKRPGFPAHLYVTEFQGAVGEAIGLGCSGITIAYDRISEDQIAELHGTGLSVTLFGSKGPRSHRQAFRSGADRLQTDRPAYAVSLRAPSN